MHIPDKRTRASLERGISTRDKGMHVDLYELCSIIVLALTGLALRKGILPGDIVGYFITFPMPPVEFVFYGTRYYGGNE